MPKTVKVRIAVAVDSTGDWNAVGWRDCGVDCDDENAMSYAEDTIGCVRSTSFIEAELPVPEVPTVQGTVEKVEARTPSYEALLELVESVAAGSESSSAFASLRDSARDLVGIPEE